MPKKNRNQQAHARYKRLYRLVLWIGGLTVIGYLVFPLILGHMGLLQYLKMRNTHNEMRTEMQRLSVENIKIQKDIQALRSDPDLIETMARQRLGLVRPGEVVFQFNDRKQ